jgi:hypothetical protein
MDGEALLWRAGGVLTILVGREPTDLPGEMVTTEAVIEWKDRTGIGRDFKERCERFYRQYRGFRKFRDAWVKAGPNDRDGVLYDAKKRGARTCTSR